MNFYINARFLTQRITGVQRFAIEIARELKKLDANIKFVAPRNIVQNEIAQELKPIIFGRFTGHMWEQIELPYFIRKQKGALLNLANTAPLNLQNHVVTICDLGFLRHPEFFSRPFYYFYRFLIPRIVERSNLIVTISEFSKNEILELLPVDEKKIIIIYPAVKSDSNKLSEQTTEKFILAVSSLDPRKNFLRLIQAFIKLNRPDMSLFIYGEKHKSFSHHMLNEIEANPRIKFLGYVDEKRLFQLYRSAELFVYPTLYEGFGLPPLEAMANDCPVLASDIPVIREICGEAVFYCNPLKIDDIAAQINFLLSNPGQRARLIEEGRKQMLKYSWRCSSLKLKENYENLKFSPRIKW